MADIELVIKMPEEDYKRGTLGSYFECYSMKLHDIILNGTPLPKGHGRLIDADKLKCIRPQDVAFHKVLQHSKTVIKADKERD